MFKKNEKVFVKGDRYDYHSTMTSGYFQGTLSEHPHLGIISEDVVSEEGEDYVSLTSGGTLLVLLEDLEPTVKEKLLQLSDFKVANQSDADEANKRFAEIAEWANKLLDK